MRKRNRSNLATVGLWEGGQVTLDRCDIGCGNYFSGQGLRDLSYRLNYEITCDLIRQFWQSCRSTEQAIGDEYGGDAIDRMARGRW